MKTTKLVGMLSIIAGIVMAIAGIVTYVTVSQQLASENITVPDDAAFLAGDKVDGPFSAFAQADIINHHALDASEGKTYAELGGLARQAEADGDTELQEKYTQQRGTVMNASFLRASLFTSVVAFGVAALVIGLGILFGLIGWALVSLANDVDRRAVVARDEVLVS
ncbi:aromatic ring-opening dioxygenase LigA [Tessaracoccus sp. OS52]|uniref:aromatic ring-opening dioxygenase LigA n=1 Tax=Tessaracoccus sp. OS52 TaxID=2886691 RepID=UPI001D129B23|nr:aromatic ring-opening dioxygenase LigA [Tessaracoccus sp. OS52]MCC2593158.1 aromatic ring-opening dioxygenase LigA [Tessaracoccus sp. OS52]